MVPVGTRRNAVDAMHEVQRRRARKHGQPAAGFTNEVHQAVGQPGEQRELGRLAAGAAEEQQRGQGQGARALGQLGRDAGVDVIVRFYALFITASAESTLIRHRLPPPSCRGTPPTAERTVKPAGH